MIDDTHSRIIIILGEILDGFIPIFLPDRHGVYPVTKFYNKLKKRIGSDKDILTKLEQVKDLNGLRRSGLR